MESSPTILEQPIHGDSPGGYRPLAGSFDEMVGATGLLRAHWKQFFSTLGGIDSAELRRRWQDARRLIRENGVTYNVYSDTRGVDRPWQLDPIPLLIPEEFATRIETGLVQRARLLEKILEDIYGPQRLLAEGILPPELVFSHPGFLRQCYRMPTPSNLYLHLYAADVGRSSDGSVWALHDRTQAPSGAGYALENRIVLSRMLPDVFRDCRVQRLAMFFRTLRETLRSIAPHHRENPRVVLLTPGSYNETYFEHSYLARYLGYTLVEGGDLTVRDNHVYLKVLGGLQPVDVILRRVDDDFCDPLELRGDSILGVPGLVQAAQSGNVAIANALGSGLVESRALMTFLPAICRAVLGEELQIPSVPLWWCGDPKGLSHVLANLDRLVIRPAFPGRSFEQIMGSQLSSDQREALAERIRSRPNHFVGQENLTLSAVPVLAGDRLEPRHMVVRVFLCANEGSYSVMPGGLTRFTASPNSMVVSMQQGGGSKDTWILSREPVNTYSLLQTVMQPVELSRGGSDLPSRAADNLFWLGRYVERSESLVRLLRAILVRLTEESGLQEAPELDRLLRTLTFITHSYPGFAGPDGKIANPQATVLSLLFDNRWPNSLATTLNSLHRAAGMARDRLSTDMWRVLSGLEIGSSTASDEDGAAWRDLGNGERPEALSPSDVLVLMNRMLSVLSSFVGLAVESMTRGQAWRFLDMGRKMERSLHLTDLLRHTLVEPAASEGPIEEALLEIADSSMTYRRRYLGSLQTAPVLDLLIADETNPRSLAFQLTALADHVDRLPRDPANAHRNPEQRIALDVLTRVRLADIEIVTQVVEGETRRTRLDMLLRQIGSELPLLSDAITQSYLTHLQTSRHLLSSNGAGRE